MIGFTLGLIVGWIASRNTETLKKWFRLAKDKFLG